MPDKDILFIWNKISAVISDELAINKDFALKMNAAIIDGISASTQKKGETISRGITAKPSPKNTAASDGAAANPPKKRNRRSPAVIDPFALLEKGEDKLAEALTTLTVEELKDVIAANGMDTAKLAMKWKKRERLEKHIIEATTRRASRGEAFWNAAEKTVVWE